MQFVQGSIRIGLLAAALSTAAGNAADTGYEINPYFGYRGGGGFNDTNTAADLDIDESSAAGFTLSRPLDPGRRLELWYSRQASELTSSGPVTGEPLFDIDVHYLHLGGTVAAGEWDAVHPFVSGGLGVSHFSPGRSGLGSDTRLSMSLGAGGRIPLGPAVGLRFDARWVGTLMNSDSTLFCDDGSCALQVDGDLLHQWELGAGMYVAF